MLMLSADTLQTQPVTHPTPFILWLPQSQLCPLTPLQAQFIHHTPNPQDKLLPTLCASAKGEGND